MTTGTFEATIANMNVNAEIVVTGTEFLLGELVDTNSSYLARRLRTIGINLFYVTCVGDNEERMARVLSQALERSDLIITSGGLGPTVDDVTRGAVARATGRELILHEDLLEQIRARFERWGRSMTDNNRRQAYLPKDAIPLENPVGTAPCFIVEDPRGVIISLPGVPRELEYLTEQRILPYLRERFDLREVIITKVLKTCAIGESTIDDRIKDLMTHLNPTVGLAAHPAQTDIRITAKAETEEEADRLIAQMEAVVRDRLGDVIYGVDKQRLEEVVVEMMAASNVTLSLLETVTRGSIARRLKSVSNGQMYIKNSVVLDKLSEPLLEQLVVVIGLSSPEIEEAQWTGEQMTGAVAREIRRRDDVDYALALISAVGTDELPYAPVNSPVWCALATPQGTIVRTFRFGGESDLLIPWVSGMALDILRRALMGKHEYPNY